MQNNTSVTMLDTSLIIPNKYQPRKVFDENALNTLAESIKEYGIINPILVRKKEDKYEIIAGERRFRAAKKIGLSEIPVIIKNADEQQMAELALIENLERQGLSPIEEAKSYEEIMRIGNQTQESLAKKIGKSQAAIANKIRLLSLPEEIQDALANKKISERHARSLLTVHDKDKQINLLNRIMKEKLTVKETDEIINKKDVDEQEIKQAISDIMKSLNIKEEEKEDDNMNNGNFFPNFDNNNSMNNNASLNMMNMQSMNQAPMEAAPEMVMPTVNIPVQEPVAPQMPEQPMMQPQFDTNMNNSFNPMAGFMAPPEAPIQPAMNPVEQPMMQQPVIQDSPLFGAPMANVNPMPESTTSQAPVVDEPLFNPNVVMPTIEPQVEPPMMQPTVEPTMEPVVAEPVNEPDPMPEGLGFMAPNSFEIPVVNNEPAPEEPVEPPVQEPIEQDKLTQLQELLTNNGFEFKSFSNDTTNCIIIELPRN